LFKREIGPYMPNEVTNI